ncbi:hypothetical protein G6F56_008415 [Rhizopus delemar]|nr:hypothetical protein G6F56_008415 [Rhizopus delemar]
MPLKPKWLSDTLSIIFSVYYLIFADAAEEKVRRIRATISVEQLRYSWEKVDKNPFLRLFSRWMLQPRMELRDRIEVKRGDDKPPIDVYRYYAKNRDSWKDHDTILMSTPGGGFISMPPPCHEDALTAWAKRTGLPVISVNYKKAPEYPFPWSIEECFDLYQSILQTKGKVIGLSGEKEIKIILAGDSAQVSI